MPNVKVFNGKLSTDMIIDDKNVIISDRESPVVLDIRVPKMPGECKLRYAEAVSAPLAPTGSTQAAGRKYSEIAAASSFCPA
jgi:hypothetical protein